MEPEPKTSLFLRAYTAENRHKVASKHVSTELLSASTVKVCNPPSLPETSTPPDNEPQLPAQVIDHPVHVSIQQDYGEECHDIAPTAHETLHQPVNADLAHQSDVAPTTHGSKKSRTATFAEFWKRHESQPMQLPVNGSANVKRKLVCPHWSLHAIDTF